MLVDICKFKGSTVNSVCLGMVQGYGDRLLLLKTADRNNVDERLAYRRWKEIQACVGS